MTIGINEMTLEEIENSLRSLNYDELKQLNQSVVSNMKFLSEREGAQKKRSLILNSQVQFTQRGGQVLQGTLIKKNRTKAVVSVQAPGEVFPTKWTVPFSMLSEVEA